MFVADLHCENGHLFEGWFASSDELASQQARGLLTCPSCGSHQVERRLSAPRLNVSGLKAERLGLAPHTTQAEGSPVQGVPGAGSDALNAGATFSGRQAPPEASAPLPPEAAHALAQMQSLYWQAVRHVLAHTEDVGERFVDEVRGMHQGELAVRPVRGQASQEEREALRDEGIEVMAVPIPADLKGTLQ